MTDIELHDRLAALGAHIAARRAALSHNDALFKAQHQLTGSQLEERYRILKQKLDREVADEEANGHHIGNLEIAVRAWFESLDAKT